MSFTTKALIESCCLLFDVRARDFLRQPFLLIRNNIWYLPFVKCFECFYYTYLVFISHIFKSSRNSVIEVLDTIFKTIYHSDLVCGETWQRRPVNRKCGTCVEWPRGSVYYTTMDDGRAWHLTQRKQMCKIFI